MIKIIFSVLCGIFSLNLYAETDSLVVERLNRVAETLVMPEVKPGDAKIRFPRIPEGYELHLRGTDKLPVVDTAGNIGKALINQDVYFYFVLTDRKSGIKKDITNLKLAITGENRNAVGTNACPAVIPAIREWVGGNGNYIFRQTGRVVIDPADADILKEKAEILVADLKEQGNWNYVVKVGKPVAGDVYLTLTTSDRQLGDEGYRLTIDNMIHIEALATRGAFWGTRTLLQMLHQQGNELVKGIARDYPKYSRRGFTLDVARKFIRLDFVKAYVKIMAYYKMNDFHIHLNDNGFLQYFDNDWDKTYAAFRLESDLFPGLTAKDGHYTKAEFRALQKEGMAYGINVVPEIDVPAHSLAFSHYRKSLGSEKYGMDHLDILNPATYSFLDSLFSEYIAGPDPVFVGPEVHIGTDEYSKEVAEEFRAFTDHYLRYVQGLGKRARMWGALTHAQGKTPVTSKGVIMNAWYNGYADPKTMVEAGYDLISTPDGCLYIVPAAGYYYDYLNTEFLYEKWEPVMIGKQVFPFGHPQILGGTFAVWNDHCGNGITEKDIHHRAFPAMQVLAQKMWTGACVGDNYDAFCRVASGMPEAPGINIMGKVPSKSELVLSYHPQSPKVMDLSGNNYGIVDVSRTGISKTDGFVFDGRSQVELPVPEIGYDYTVRFEINPERDNKENAVLFRSPHSQLVLNKEGQLAFMREGYCYHFDYILQPGVWINIAIQGDHKGTALFVDGKPVQLLQGKERVVKDKKGKESKMYIQQTLVFPLKWIGDLNNGFKGKMRSLEVYNRKMQSGF